MIQNPTTLTLEQKHAPTFYTFGFTPQVTVASSPGSQGGVIGQIIGFIEGLKYAIDLGIDQKGMDRVNGRKAKEKVLRTKRK